MPEEIKISKAFQRLIQTLEKKENINKNTPFIKVSEMVSKVAFFYEKIRNVVDYRDEHLLRKNAIERILKRQFVVEQKTNNENIAKTLISELIRAHYLNNNSVPEYKIAEVAKNIERINYIIKKLAPRGKQKKKNSKIFYGLLACEIDEKLAHTGKEEALAYTMYELMHDKVLLTGKKELNTEEKNTQIYLSIHRSLLKYDPQMVHYLLLKMYLPEWRDNYSQEFVDSFIKHWPRYEAAILKQINHPLRERFNKIFKKYAVLFLVFKEFSEENKGKINTILAQPKLFEEKIIKICEKKYKETQAKLRRAAVRTIIYIFITKMTLALALEVPFDLFFLHQLSYISLGINILFHPLLMFSLAVSVKVPSEKNTTLIVNNLKRMIYKIEDPTTYKIKMPSGRSNFLYNFFRIFYALTFIISFGLLIYILQKLKFNILSTGLFIVFLSIVSFFGIRIRQSARELVVTKKKEGILSTLMDFFFIPIIRAGRWISLNFSKINIFVFVLDFIIEAPLKTILEISEQWFAYVKEKKEELY